MSSIPQIGKALRRRPILWRLEMEFEQLRQREHAANMLLPQYGLVALT